MEIKKRLLLHYILIFNALPLTALGQTTTSSVANNSSNKWFDCQVKETKPKEILTSEGECYSYLRRCLCGNSCPDFGECFKDIKIKNDKQSFFMQRKCLKDWPDKEVEELCVMARPFSSSELSNSDPFLDTPVTCTRTKLTYSNYYCAICNGELPYEIETWRSEVNCNLESYASDTISINNTNVIENLLYINDTWGVYLNKSAEGIFQHCNFYPSAPLSISYGLHQCNKDYIYECPTIWTDSSIKNLCNLYTNLVIDTKTKKYYKNVHCATCNFATYSDIDCLRTFSTRKFAFSPESGLSFSVLLDFGSKNNLCPTGSRWDELSRPKRCRPVVCYKNNYKYQYGSCIKISEEQNTLNNSEYPPWNLTFCDKKYFYNLTEITMGSNQTVIINATGKIYQHDEYEHRGNRIYVCVPNNYSVAMGWISLLGLSLSSFCILLHLLAFTIVPDLRNISGKNMASLCLALLVAYICFIITSFKDSVVDGCPTLASLMYYFFLASFAWMNVMAFDIWLTVRKATSRLQVTAGKQWKKFIFYSLYAWTLPGIALMVVLVIDNTTNSLVPPNYLPELGERYCWFGQRNAILVYFASPLATIMLLNIIFFVNTIKKVRETSHSTNASSLNRSQGKKVKLYLRLAIVMGLSWVSGIVAGFFQNEYMWYLFIILNAFQGLYILLAYTCTRKVRKALKSKKLSLFKISTGDPIILDSSSQSQINSLNFDSNQVNTATTNLGSTTTINSTLSTPSLHPKL